MPELLLVSLAATGGLRDADLELAGALRRAGAEVAVATAAAPPEVRTLVATDLAWALAARRAALAAGRPRGATIYSSVTAGLLAPWPGAIRFDAPAAGNRPGRHGLWQRPVERERLRRAPLLLPWSPGGLAEAGVAHGRSLVVPVPVGPAGTAPPPGSPPPRRDVAAIAYAANPAKKGLDRVLTAWRAARREGEELLVAGLDGRDEPGVRHLGRLERAEYRALLRRARVFVAAARREDYGIAQLEALADGCRLVTTPSPGPYAALPLARELDASLVVAPDGLGAAIRRALDVPAAVAVGYAARAATLLAPWASERVDRLVAEALLPRLRALPR